MNTLLCIIDATIDGICTLFSNENKRLLSRKSSSADRGFHATHLQFVKMEVI